MRSKRHSAPIQLPLWLRLRDDATLGNFYPVGNEMLVDMLQRLFDTGSESCLYLWGKKGSGCSHLLQAACHMADSQGKRSVYLPLAELADYPVSVLENLEQLDLICIDDIQAISGTPQWETALFHLFNRVRDAGKKLVMAGEMPPRQLQLDLPDLHSRLSWGVVVQVKEMGDEDKLQALQLRARVRGMDLPDDVARFILFRCPRDMKGMFTVLDRLDDASLTAKRKLTIPFVKTTMNW
ncbi:DnaA regulatory inactivator Hda [Pokkaliibacter sp. CJK22405]|uniref:DnaA regulatory inactivator Hda n=1 Tax=Pokkaliibacter sp. CJK22405 TaxID=3384615 RepID=UPI003984A721